MTRLLLAFGPLAFLSVAASAQDVPPRGTIALTPEQREAALEAGAVRATDKELQGGGGDRRVHGEIGVEIGSRGERAAYGTLVAPIGQNGMAAVSYGTGRGPRWHGRHGRFRSRSAGAGYSSGVSPDGFAEPLDTENVNPD